MAKRLDGSRIQDETWHAGRPRPWPPCVRWGPSTHSPRNFRPITVVAKWLDASRLIWRYASTQVTLHTSSTMLLGLRPTSIPSGIQLFGHNRYGSKITGVGGCAPLGEWELGRHLTQLPSPKDGPQFSAHFYCGQTAGWIKMPLGMKVGLD